MATIRADRASLLGHPVPGAEDLADLRGRIERLDVRRVMALEADRGRRSADDPGLVVRFGDVLRPRSVADLALHVLQLVDVRHGATARLLVAGHVAGHALEVELL